MAIENHKFLTNSVLITIVCGIIIAFIGNLILKYANPNKDPDYDIATCDKSILNELQPSEESNGNNGYILSFTGNIIAAFGILFLLLLSTLFVTKSSATGTFEILKRILLTSLPSVLTLGVIICVTVINSIYRENLVTGHVANEYYLYSLLSSIMILIQVGFLIKYITDIASNKDTNIKYIVAVFSTINFMLLGKMQVILQHFSTDG
jgi:hypothetical protein